MTLVLAHPFRLAGPSAATVDDASDAGVAQDLALLVTTRAGEREMTPSWGISDPVFGAVSVAEVNAALALLGPAGVEVTEVSLSAPTSTTARLTLAFTRAS